MKTAICLGILIVVGARAVQAGHPVPLELNWQFRYDDEGRLAAAVGPDDREVRFDYARDPGDKYDVITRRTADGDATRYVHEGVRRIAMRDAAGDVRYEHDALGRLAAVRRQGAPAVNYTYDTLDRPTSVSLGEDATVRYVYDFLGRLERLETPAGAIAYNYQTGQSMMIRTLPNGLRTIWQYHPDGSLQELAHVNQDNQILLRFRYVYCPDQLIRKVTEWSPRGERVLNYEYDQVHRLTAVADSQGGRTEYRYDKLGNRTARLVAGRQTDTSEYDWAGRLVRHNGQECTHDAAGNLAGYQNGGIGRALTFDALDLLQSVQTGSGTVRYEYDGDGNLVRRSVDGKTTRFVPDPMADIWRPLLATGADGERTFYVWEGDTPLAEIRGTEVTFFLHDHLGSVRLAADADGQIVRQSSYRPFGSPDGESVAEGLMPGFTGLFFDARAGLYLTRARGYDPQLGRFLQRDPQLRIPFASQEDTAVYAYCGNEPLNWLDRVGGRRRRIATEPPQSPRGLQSVNTDFERAVDNALRNIPQDGVVHVLVTGVGAGWKRSQSDAQQHLGDAAIGIRTTTGFAPWDALVAARDQAYGSTRHDVVRHLEYIQQAAENRGLRISLDIHAHSNGAINLRNEAANLAHAVENGLRIASVTTYAVAETKFLSDTCSRLGISYTAETNIKDPIVYLTLYPRSFSSHLQQEYGISRGFANLTAFVNVQAVKVANLFRLPKNVRYHGLGTEHGYTISPTKNSANVERGFPDTSLLDTSPVGGVYLRGAGEALSGLGPLRGIALDEATGRLVLLAEDSSDVALPPLRIDDLVTVFRSVYLYGEGPSVTIDPNPQDPRKYAMIVVHGKGTENTYVGWVLYEADRLMKGYGQGVDNISRKEIDSRVPGYAEMLEAVYFGGDVPLKNQEQGIWERFWIVPDAVNRFDGPRRELTLFDVPLKVRTQKMTWHNGRLVDDPSGQSSPGALAFTSWFTRRYDEIGAEQDLTYLTPPPESGITHPVPVFAELRRVALMTAIAEKLRDQGVPMPPWMRDHRVREVPVDRFTPGLEVTRERAVEGGTRVSRIFGGVNLSPPTESVRTFRGASDAARVPAGERAEVGRNLARARDLEPAVTDWLNADVLNSVGSGQIAHQGRTYQAACLPGGETRALGACRLAETDLAVPLHQDVRMEFTRHFHSFFLPGGEFGDGWTLNLPRLVERRRPLERTGKGVKYRVEPLLTDPLGGVHAVFDQQRMVPELNAQMLVSDGADPILGLSLALDKRIGFETQVVHFRDGRSWHFDRQGRFAARIEGPLAVLYRHDDAGRLRSLQGYHGQDPRGEIRLDYDARGRIILAEAGDDARVRYTYNDENQLSRVTTPDGDFGYEYADGLVSAVTRDGQISRRYRYDSQGRLLGQRIADGEEIAYQWSAEPDGTIAVRTITAENSQGEETARYDATLRPLSQQLADGSRLQWRYDEDATTGTLTQPDGERYTLRRSADGRLTEWHWPDGAHYATEHDAGGRPLTITAAGETAARYQWRPDGQLAQAALETSVVRPAYGPDGVLNEIFVAPPEEQGPSFRRWMQTDYDAAGRPTRVTDFAGLEVHMQYDANGQPATLTQRQGDALHRVQLHRDEQGRLVQWDTSWGGKQRNHYAPETGDLQRIEFQQGQHRAEIRYDRDRIVAAHQFDGGQYRVTYHDDGAAEDLPRTVTAPNGLVIGYGYDSEQRLTTVTCGDAYRLNFSYDDQGRLTRLAIAP